MASAPLPREIIKWLQALDLSFSIKNPKRDFSNGYLVAEILSRYHPQDVDINTFENGSRLEAKVDNWEQLYKLFKKKNIGISKAEFDPVIHCAPGAAVVFIYRIYEICTKCAVRANAPIKELMNIQHELPPFMRDTASKRLKDPEIARIEDNVERTIVAIDVLGSYHQERRSMKATEAPALIRQERRLRLGLSQVGSDGWLRVSSLEEKHATERGRQGGFRRGKSHFIGEILHHSLAAVPRSFQSGWASKRLKAFYINTDLDDARRFGLESTCDDLDLDTRFN
eukprot:symbB.v1.2.010826.t1/scaffold711.1/size292957/7